MTVDIGVNAEIDRVRLKEQASVGTPDNGYGFLYVKSGGLYFKGDNGTEIGPLAAAGAGGGDANHGYYQYLASLLEPDAIEPIQVDSFSYVVGGSETKLMTSSWNTRLGSSGRLELRDIRNPIPLRDVTVTGLGSGATATFIDPSLPTYSDARTTYFDRMQEIFENQGRYLPITSSSPVPFLPGPYGAIIVQATNYNFAWISLRFMNDVYGINLMDEINDSTAIRFTNVPYMAVNKLIANEVRGESGGSQSGGMLYYIVPSTWSVIADSNIYDFRDDFMGASLDTATDWTRSQSSAGNVEIDTLYQWLKITGNASWGTNGAYSQASISRANGKKLVVDVYTGRNATANNGLAIGFSDGTGHDWTDFAHGLWFGSNGAANILKIFEGGNDRGAVGSGFVAGGTYRVRITLGASNNAVYEIQGGVYGELGGSSWTDITPGTNGNSTTPLHAGISNSQSGTMYISDMKIY